jgi:disulfide bond formation protein DsbB
MVFSPWHWQRTMRFDQASGARASMVRWLLLAMALWVLGLLAVGLYLQHVVGLEPCPMCIVQRYLWLLVLVTLVWAVLWVGARRALMLLAVVWAVLGALTAARQSWLQWYPPPILTCGRDLFGMIEAFPLQRVLPMVLRGSGDCSAVDWTFWGLSLANWGFIHFVAIALVLLAAFWQTRRRRLFVD